MLESHTQPSYEQQEPNYEKNHFFKTFPIERKNSNSSSECLQTMAKHHGHPHQDTASTEERKPRCFQLWR